MNARRVRIVVGEGRSSRQGMLRFVLDGEGYDVVGDASSAAELARVLAIHAPDVVVLDDGIGATAVGMVREMLPAAKVIVVWPEAVMPIGGAARVDPSQVLSELGPAVALVTGVAAAGAAGAGAEAIELAKHDPSALRRMLRDADAGANAEVTPLPLRDPTSPSDDLGESVAAGGEPIIEDREPAPVVILPVTPDVGDDDEVVLHVPDADDDDDRSGAAALGAGAVAGAAATLGLAGTAAASEREIAAAAEPGADAGSGLGAQGARVGAQSSLNRRLGNLALAGAAAASAVVLALALGGAKVPVAGISGEAPTVGQPPTPTVPTEGNNGPGHAGSSGSGGGQGGTGSAFYPILPLSVSADIAGLPSLVDGPPILGTFPHGDNGSHLGGLGGGGDHGGQGGENAHQGDSTPGHSGDHNPSGGPPGLDGNGHGNGDHSNSGGNGNYDHTGDHHGHAGEHHGHAGEHGHSSGHGDHGHVHGDHGHGDHSGRGNGGKKHGSSSPA